MTAILRMRPRTVPLGPRAVVAEGTVAARLARYLLARDDASLGKLSGVAAPGLLVITGPEEALPWVDGVCYLGLDPEAPALLLPTALEPEVPVALLERAILSGAGNAATPLALLDAPVRVVPTGESRPIERAHLLAWMDGAP
ncbi:MAG TPA: hypothetical protein VFM53_08285 [Anaeromyxobacteraceae bacterium]|nr:hypothetical protein [Anaeromyxobacteraceae bacterium]